MSPRDAPPPPHRHAEVMSERATFLSSALIFVIMYLSIYVTMFYLRTHFYKCKLGKCIK